MFKFSEIWQTGNRWNRALLIWQNELNFAWLSSWRYCTDRAQNLPGPAPDNVLSVLQISPKSVYFNGAIVNRVNTAKTRRKVNQIFCGSIALSRIINKRKTHNTTLSPILSVLFLPRDAVLVRYMLSSCVSLSVRPSVCLSVTSRHCIKRLNAGSCKQRHTIAQGLSSFLTPTISAKFRLGYPNGDGKEKWGRFKSVIFDRYLAISQKRRKIGI